MSKGRGKKLTKSTQKRKGASNNIPPLLTEFHNNDKQQPFHLTFIAGLIKKCYGCGQEFSSHNRKSSNDVILKRFDYREYINPLTKLKNESVSLPNTYYHLNADCARKVVPTFEMTNIIIHDEIKKSLSPEHITVLNNLNITC